MFLRPASGLHQLSTRCRVARRFKSHRRWLLLPAILLGILFVCEGRRALAQGIVATPNCIQPFDTLKVKSGGWKLGYSQTISLNPCFPGGFPCHLIFAYTVGTDDPRWHFQDAGKAFVYKDQTFFDESYIGDYRIEVHERDQPGAPCVSLPFRIIADIGNPWNLVPQPCQNPTSPSCRPILRMTFDPSLWCNTAACSKIRILQAYRDSGVCGASCFRILTNTEQLLEDGPSRDSTTVAGWTIDAKGNKPNAPGERDPYMNGNDPGDMQFTGHRVGKQGATPGIALVKDQPKTTLPGEPPSDVTEFVTTFETNAFCSDGPIQGEWLGRALWRWNKPRGGPATITILSVTRELPTQQFMDALRGWCQARGFEWPRDDVVATEGGTRSCPP